MWLPKDERMLLQGYYATIGEIGKQHEFSSENLLDFIKSSASPKPPLPGNPQYKDWFKEWNKVLIANKTLEERKLIIWSRAPDLVVYMFKEAGYNPCLILALTLNGYDLGRKYNSCLIRTGLWFAEYKDHWFWLIISFLGGIVGALIVNWLSKNN